MNDQTIALIDKLAIKLGTTSEYLWGALLKQAPISSTINLIQSAIIIIGWVVIYRLHKHFSNSENKISYYNEEEALVFPMGMVLLTLAIFTIIGFCSIDVTLSGFFNPGYWALNKILTRLKSQ